MTRIAPVDLRYNPRTLWFDAGELDMHEGDGVVVSTARGTEFGHVAGEVFEATEEQVSALKSPLKPVRRVATPEDEQQAEEMERLSREAMPIFREMAAEASEEMRPVSVEYLFDGDKAVFYFESEERIDFRELVRNLAARFHVRVDMRQIGVRDEARMIGGLGHCGQELCCKRMGGEFCPVSIRMAKEQDLSLNPQKISGLCGRLMCCLRYEYDAYKDFKSRAPKQNSQVETPDGMAKVVELDVPREVVSLKLEDGKPVKVPLSDFEPPAEGARPKVVGRDAWDRAVAESSLGAMGSGTAVYAVTQLKSDDKLADPTVVRRVGHGASGADGGGKAGRSGGRGASGRKADEAAASSGRKPRPRRSTKVGAPEGAAAEPAAASEASGRKQPKQKARQKQQSQGGAQGGRSKQGQAQGQRSSQKGKGGQQAQPKGQQAPKSSPRPGQNSSGLRNPQVQGRPQEQSAPRAEDDAHRRTRRRTHKASGGEATGTTSSATGAPSASGATGATGAMGATQAEE